MKIRKMYHRFRKPSLLSFFLSFFFFLWSIVGWKFLLLYQKSYIYFAYRVAYIAKNRSSTNILLMWKILKEDVSILHVSPFICIFFSARDLRHRDSRRNFLINPANVKPPFRESLLETHLQRASHVAMAVFRRFRSSYYLRCSVRADRFELHTFIRIRRSTFNSTRIATLAIIEVLEGAGLHTSPTMR